MHRRPVPPRKVSRRRQSGGPPAARSPARLTPTSPRGRRRGPWRRRTPSARRSRAAAGPTARRGGGVSRQGSLARRGRALRLHALQRDDDGVLVVETLRPLLPVLVRGELEGIAVEVIDHL